MGKLLSRMAWVLANSITPVVIGLFFLWKMTHIGPIIIWALGAFMIPGEILGYLCKHERDV